LGPKDDPATMAGYPEFAIPGSPNHPERLVPRIEATVAGCDLLLERWQELADRAAAGGIWQASDGFKAIRLIGKLAGDVADDDEVAVIISSTVMLTTKPRPKFADFWIGDPPIGYDKHGNFDDDPRFEALADDEEHQCKLLAFEQAIRDFNYARKSQYDEWCKPFSKRLRQSPLKGLAPADADEARRLLASLAAAHINRLQVIRTHNQRLADSDAAKAPAKLAVEPGHEGDLDRRYTLARERAVQRAFAEFMKARKMSKSGDMPHVFEEEKVATDAAENAFALPELDEGDLVDLAPEPIVVPKVNVRDWCSKCNNGAPVFRSEAKAVESGEGEPSREPSGDAQRQSGGQVAVFRNEATAPKPGTEVKGSGTETPERAQTPLNGIKGSGIEMPKRVLTPLNGSQDVAAFFRNEAMVNESGEGEPPGEPSGHAAYIEPRPPDAPRPLWLTAGPRAP
jgi:hypothetical protein